MAKMWDIWLNENEKKTITTKKINENISGFQWILTLTSLKNIPFLKKIHAYDDINNCNTLSTSRLNSNGLDFYTWMKITPYNAALTHGDGFISSNDFMLWTPLFRIKNLYIKDWIYIFESDTWSIFTAEISDFNVHGLMSDSLNIWEKKLLDDFKKQETIDTPKKQELTSKVVKTKVVKLENLIEGLQKKLQVTDFSNPIVNEYLRKNWLTNWTWYKYDSNNYFNEYFPQLHKYLNNSKDNQSEVKKNDTFNNIPLFEISEVYTQDDFYIFKSKEWYFFNVNINDFNSNWTSAQSFSLWKPSLNTPSNLIRDFTLETTSTSINLIKNNSILSTIVWDYVVVINKDSWDIIVVNENLLEYIQIGANTEQTPQNHPIAHPYWKIEKIRIDKNSNFLLIVSKYDDKQKLHIVNRKTLEEVQSFDDIVDIIEIDNKNDLTCVDREWKLISIDTNFDQFPVWFVDNGWIIAQKQIIEIKDKAIAWLEAILDNGWIQIDTQNLDTKNHSFSYISEERTKLIQKIWELPVWDDTLKWLFHFAETPEDIKMVSQAFLQLKNHPNILALPGITDTIESEINNKSLQIQLKTLHTTLKMLENTFDTAKEKSEAQDYSYLPILLSLQKDLENIKISRSQLPIIEGKIDTKISELDSKIQSEILAFRIKNIENIKKVIDDNIKILSETIVHIPFISQVTQIYASSIYRESYELIEYLDTDKDLYKKRLQDIISERIKALWEEEKQKKKNEENLLQEKIWEIQHHISDLSRVIESIYDENILEMMKKDNILVTMIYNALWNLPKSESEKLSLEMESIFYEAKQRIRMKKVDTKWIIWNLDEYGIHTSLYYTDRSKKQVWYKLIGHKTKDGTIKMEIHYDDGTTFDIERYLSNPSQYADGIVFDTIDTEISQKEFISLQKNISSWQNTGKIKLEKVRNDFRNTNNTDEKVKLWAEIQYLRSYYKKARSLELFSTHLANNLELNPRSRLELPNPRFIVLSEEKEILNKMSVWFEIQRMEQKWIDILEGPPGLWKTEICRFFAAISNREIVRVQCSKMDPSDLFFSPQLKAWETTRQPAEWLKLMQKPGTVILFDEIDKLNPQSFERLHSLFDSARAIYDPQIWWVKADKDCLFVGTRNSYEKMSNPIVSRSVIIQIQAPSKENEAYKISKYTNEYISNLNFEEFKNLPSQSLTWLLIDYVAYIDDLVNIFSDLRLEQKSDDEKFEYEISYRDAEQIFLRYNKNPNEDFKKIVLDVLIPKARAVVYDTDDKDIQEAIVQKIVDKNIL